MKAGAKLAACPFCLDFFEHRNRSTLTAGAEGGDYVAAQVGKAQWGALDVVQ